jgi:hypothetical protein
MALFANGKMIDSNLVFSEAQLIDNATGGLDSTNTVHFVGCRNGKLQVNVVAATDISIANGQSFTIAIQYGTTASPTTSLYDVLYTRTGSGSAVTHSAGDKIAQYMIPADRAAAYDYAKLVYTTSADEGNTEKVDAFINIIT